MSSTMVKGMGQRKSYSKAFEEVESDHFVNHGESKKYKDKIRKLLKAPT